MTVMAEAEAEVAAEVPVDPATLEPFKPGPKFDGHRSLYVATVLLSYGEVLAEQNGVFVYSDTELVKRALQHVQANLVTPDLVDKATTLGLDRTDIASVLYGRPVAEQERFPEETAFLTSRGWGVLSAKGAVAKALPTGMVMTSRKGTRTVTREDGVLGRQEVQVRYATTSAAEVEQTRYTATIKAAGLAMERLGKEAEFLMGEFPDDKELFAGPMIANALKAVASLAKTAERAGLQLSPPQAKAIAAIKAASVA